MDLSLVSLIHQMATYPSLGVIIVLVLLVTAVSGATDAPNAVATAVSTRCLTPTRAFVMASVFDCIGLIGMTFISTAVAHTMFAMVNFSGSSVEALNVLMAAMIGAIGWGVFCWFMGIPISKSHALIAGITGGAIAMNGFEGVIIGEWMKVIYGMVFSLVAGLVLGWVAVKIVELLFKRANRKNATGALTKVQIALSMFMSSLHGAQDGQKFMSIAMMGIMLSFGLEADTSAGFPVWLMLACSLAIAAGLFIGGKRIIKTVGMRMVKLEVYQSVAASMSTIATLFISSVTGMPVSTSHCSTAGIMGVGASRGIRNVNWSVAKSMVMAWVLTFPCCGVIGFVLAKLFMLFS